MRSFVFAFLATVLSMGSAFAQGPVNRAEIEKQIIKMEQAINEAVAKNDAATFRKLVGDETIGIDASGVSTTAEFAKMMGEMKVEPGWKIDASRFVWVNDSAAVHIYRWSGKGTFKGQPVPSPMHASTVWANRGGRWVPVFHQETVAMPPMK